MVMCIYVTKHKFIKAILFRDIIKIDENTFY